MEVDGLQNKLHKPLHFVFAKLCFICPEIPLLAVKCMKKVNERDSYSAEMM